jgi:hypothetical protein
MSHFCLIFALNKWITQIYVSFFGITGTCHFGLLPKKALNKWITQIYVSFFWITGTCQKNGVLSHNHAKKLRKTTPRSTQMPIRCFHL